MTVKINPSNISGTIYAPASKSSMQRACAAALLINVETIISNPGKSNDDLAALDVIQKLGAVVTRPGNNKLSIKGINFPYNFFPDTEGQETILNFGESGLGLRMFAPVAALCKNEIILNGSGSLLQRPIDFFDAIFPQLGVSIKSDMGRLPLKIKGPLQPKNISIDGSLSSQFLTGLLMAYAKACTAPVCIKVKNLKSKPYIDLTLQILKHFGWEVENKNYQEFFFRPATNNQSLTVNYTVEGDWSNAAFLLVAAAIGGQITIAGLDVSSAQGDKAILEALGCAGAGVSFSDNKIVVSSNTLKAFHFNATECPDLFPPLAALASYCKGQSKIEGVHRLTHKESNRAIALQQEFGKMGIEIKLQNDVMLIQGNAKIKGAVVHSHYDHRIAMACAVAALQANGTTTIHDAESINKSYPDFYDHLISLNALLQKT